MCTNCTTREHETMTDTAMRIANDIVSEVEAVELVEEKKEEEEEILFTCDSCDTAYKDSDNMTSRVDPDDSTLTICDDCFQDRFTICTDCGRSENNDDTTWVNDDPICQRCYENNYFYCEGCNRDYHNDEYGSDGMCSGCENSDEDSTPCRNYDKSDVCVESGKRAYSCEIECYYPDRDSFDNVVNNIPTCVGYTDDGSLDDNGKEFITPKLSGETGDKVLKTLCEQLNKNNFTVTKSCGLHVHIDTSDIAGNVDKIKKLILFYLIFEPVIYSYLPYSRRINRYCMPLTEFYHENELKRANNIQELEKIWYREQDIERIEYRKKERYDQSRYAGVNIHSLLSNGHIEIRHHSGTTDYGKIKNWIDLHCAILDTVVNGDFNLDDLLKVKYLLELSQKQQKMFDMLKLSSKLKKYLVARYKKFGKNNKDETICVE